MPTARKPHDLRARDIVLSHFTLGRHHDITNRLDAAAAAGCAAIGLYIRDYQRLLSEGTAPGELTEMLDARNLCLAEIEALRGWSDATPTDDYLEQERTAFEMANAFECRYVQAIGPTVDDPRAAAAGFAALCDRAADHGLVVGFEFLPFTNVVDATAALRLVQDADRANGGVCVDIWHHQRGANDLALIRAIPGDRVMGIQMSDGPLTPTLDSYYDDTLRTRVPPGEGEMDVAGFVEAVQSTGTAVPWSLEVCNEANWDKDATEFVQASADGLRRFL
ncbi:MAG: sugar phosphate isomerase/epimerase [Acidimicrobiales bacterium]|jgi:sugar phosphate isomerase/epimerase|nr:sugar phosphate isomerase/epimerase [Acidimicrobiales bacterium]